MPKQKHAHQNKLSPEFVAQLTSLEPQKKVPIIMLNINITKNLTGKRQSREERKAWNYKSQQNKL